MNNKRMRKDSILTCCSDLVLPIIITLGLYIIIHGHLSPGGGFQGGVLVAGAFTILYVSYGIKNLSKKIKVNVLKIGEDIGALGFIILAFLGLVFGGTFFKNIFYLGEAGELFSSGSIFLMNFAVGFKVFAGVSFLILIMVSNLKSKGDE